MNARAAAAILVAGLLGCPDPAPPGAGESAPPFRVHEGGEARWRWIRRTPPMRFQAGELFVTVHQRARGPDRPLPGVGLGGAEGPRYELLGGYFAPQLLVPRTELAYALTATTAGDALRLTLSSTAARAVFVVHAPTDGGAQIEAPGGAVVALRADDAIVRSRRNGRAEVELTVRANDPPRMQTPRGETVEILSREQIRWILAGPCERIRILRPVRRGSTSAFLAGVGRDAMLDDPLYALDQAPADPPELAACPAGPSTLTFRP